MSGNVSLPMILRINTSRIVVLLLASTLLLTLGVFILVADQNMNSSMGIMIVGLIFVGLGFVGLPGMFEQLRLDDKGLTIKSPLGSRTIRWREMEAIFLFAAQGQTRVGINLMAGEKAMSAWRKMGRMTAGDVGFSARFGGLKPDALVALLNRARFEHQPVAPLTPERRFALALSAIIAHVNGCRHDLLHGDMPSERLQKESVAVLVNDWSVRSLPELLQTLEWLNNEGHRDSYVQYRDLLAGRALPTDPLALLDTSAVKAMDRAERAAFLKSVALVAKHQCQHESLVAWDMCRLIAVARFGAAAGHLSDEEAWGWIEPAAIQLNDEFDSWQALCTNYFVGRAFWSDNPPPAPFEEAREFLLNDPDSPWKTVPWPTATQT